MPEDLQFARHTEVASLEEVELRRLLEEGEPPERVWAAWELGLRHGEEFADTLRDRLDVEPHFGVRRHVAIMLAGFGDVSSLERLAADDPSPYTRATACQYLCQRADADRDVARRVRTRLEEESHPFVRAALLRHLPSSPAVSVEEAVVSLRESDDRRVREAARRWMSEND